MSNLAGFSSRQGDTIDAHSARLAALNRVRELQNSNRAQKTQPNRWVNSYTDRELTRVSIFE